MILIALVMIALGASSGAVMSQLRGPLESWARGRIAANPAAHGLAGSAEYDDEVRRRTLFAMEAGLSFLHTHAEGLGLVVLFTSTVTATVVPWRPIRDGLHALIAAGGLFPLGYLLYAVAVVELGRDTGVEFAERWVLTPLGSTAIVGLTGLAVALAVLVGRTRGPRGPGSWGDRVG